VAEITSAGAVRANSRPLAVSGGADPPGTGQPPSSGKAKAVISRVDGTGLIKLDGTDPIGAMLGVPLILSAEKSQAGPGPDAVEWEIAPEWVGNKKVFLDQDHRKVVLPTGTQPNVKIEVRLTVALNSTFSHDIITIETVPNTDEIPGGTDGQGTKKLSIRVQHFVQLVKDKVPDFRDANIAALETVYRTVVTNIARAAMQPSPPELSKYLSVNDAIVESRNLRRNTLGTQNEQRWLPFFDFFGEFVGGMIDGGALREVNQLSRLLKDLADALHECAVSPAPGNAKTSDVSHTQQR
jgi:hypothetical protein